MTSKTQTAIGRYVANRQLWGSAKDPAKAEIGSFLFSRENNSKTFKKLTNE